MSERTSQLAAVSAYRSVLLESVHWVHPSWLAGVDSELVLSARQTPAGRRFLLRILAREYHCYRELHYLPDEVSIGDVAIPVG